MTHTHETCTAPSSGQECDDGLVTDYCDYEHCATADCTVIGHCECPCHAGRVCHCGHRWTETDDPKDQT